MWPDLVAEYTIKPRTVQIKRNAKNSIIWTHSYIIAVTKELSNKLTQGYNKQVMCSTHTKRSMGGTFQNQIEVQELVHFQGYTVMAIKGHATLIEFESYK